ncbi:588_t:CDS:1, partial [Scutellospora calospora]
LYPNTSAARHTQASYPGEDLGGRCQPDSNLELLVVNPAPGP